MSERFHDRYLFLLYNFPASYSPTRFFYLRSCWPWSDGSTCRPVYLHVVSSAKERVWFSFRTFSLQRWVATWNSSLHFSDRCRLLESLGGQSGPLYLDCSLHCANLAIDLKARIVEANSIRIRVLALLSRTARDAGEADFATGIISSWRHPSARGCIYTVAYFGSLDRSQVDSRAGATMSAPRASEQVNKCERLHMEAFTRVNVETYLSGSGQRVARQCGTWTSFLSERRDY